MNKITESRLALFIQELESDFQYIQENCLLLEKAYYRVNASVWGDELDLMVLGTCLHGIYNAFEGYFLRVAKFFENNIEQQMWHRDLLDRMALSIPDMRPAVISDKVLFERIDELRRFRHFFRNLYKSRLKANNLKLVYEAGNRIDEAFQDSHAAFINWLSEVMARL